MDDDLLERAAVVRREVLGDQHVERSKSSRTEFNADFQDFLARYSWGEVWSRPGIDRKLRCCITVAMVVALNRPEELRLHVRAALRNGVTQEELSEILFHSAIYCGVPAAFGAFKIAQEVLAEE
jgi:4-carboxymuconolactone decarboxylase